MDDRGFHLGDIVKVAVRDMGTGQKQFSDTGVIVGVGGSYCDVEIDGRRGCWAVHKRDIRKFTRMELLTMKGAVYGGQVPPKEPPPTRTESPRTVSHDNVPVMHTINKEVLKNLAERWKHLELNTIVNKRRPGWTAPIGYEEFDDPKPVQHGGTDWEWVDTCVADAPRPKMKGGK